MLSASGCRQQAYTELYVEHMATEIRALEDRIYEFNDEYERLQVELEVAEHRNRQLEQRLLNSSQTKSLSPSLGSDSLERSPDNAFSSPGAFQIDDELAEPEISGGGSEMDRNSELIEPIPDSYSDGVADPNSSEALPAPAERPTTPNSNLQPPNADSNFAPDAGSEPGLLMPQSNPASPNPFGNRSGPEDRSRGAVTPRRENQPTARMTSRQSARERPTDEPMDLDADDLAPPQIDFSGASPTSESAPRNIAPPQASNSRAEDDSQIALPAAILVQPASAEIVVTNDEDVSVMEPFDERVVELAFHTSLCRSENLDSTPADDAIHLVLQPRNATGQFVDATGELTVVIVDPKRTGDTAKIGYYVFDANETREHTEAFGTSQGIQLSLPWQTAEPLGDSVDVYVRLVQSDGRTLPNSKKFHVSKDGRRVNAWTPRAK